MIYVVTDREAGWRLDHLVADRLECSQSEARRVIERGQVKIDGRRSKKGVVLKLGARIDLPEKAALDPRPIAEPNAPLALLYLDDALVAVNKPVGQPSHPLRPGESGTLANAIVGHYPECAEVATDPREGGLAHRLDTSTSGVLVAARARAAWLALRAAFSESRVTKTYVAVVVGATPDEGDIDLPLAHHGAKKMRAIDDIDARAASTRYKIISRGDELTFVRAEAMTGRMHQIRAHLAAIGHPLYGDVLYGAPKVEEYPHHFLHAESVTLPHPSTGAALRIEAPIPVESIALLLRLGLSAS